MRTSEYTANQQMADTAARQYICYRQWDTCHTFYVSEVRGNGGVDWGYSPDPRQAIKLSRRQMQWFKADCARVGQQGLCHEA